MQLYLIQYETENGESACSVIAAPSIAEAINVTENPPNDFYDRGDKVQGIIELNQHTNQIISDILLEADFWKPSCQSLGSLAKTELDRKKVIETIFLSISFYTAFRWFNNFN